MSYANDHKSDPLVHGVHTALNPIVTAVNSAAAAAVNDAAVVATTAAASIHTPTATTPTAGAAAANVERSTSMQAAVQVRPPLSLVDTKQELTLRPLDGSKPLTGDDANTVARDHAIIEHASDDNKRFMAAYANAVVDARVAREKTIDLEHRLRLLKQERARLNEEADETDELGGLFRDCNELQQFVSDWMHNRLGDQTEEWIATRLEVANRFLNPPDPDSPIEMDLS